MASRSTIRDLPISSKTKDILLKLGIEDLVDLYNTTPQELKEYGLSECEINTILSCLPSHALCYQAYSMNLVSSKNQLRFSSEEQGLQLLSNLLQQKIKIASDDIYNDIVNFIRKTITKFEESDDWKEKQNILDKLFMDRFKLKKKHNIDTDSYNIEKFIVGVLDELLNAWKKYESNQKKNELFNKALEKTQKIGKELGYISVRYPSSPQKIIDFPIEEYELSKAASKENS